LDAVVLDADERQSLVSVRALGRAGIRVGAFDASRIAPAFSSRWCSVRRRLPDAADQDGYVDALLAAVRQFRPGALLVARDSTIEAVRARRTEIEAETTLALPPEPALEIAVNKERTLSLAERLGVAVPVSEPVPDGDGQQPGGRTGFPAVVKPVRSWVSSPSGGTRLGCLLAVDAGEVHAAAERATRLGGRVVLQQWLQGRREAVSLFCVDGKVHARFAQVAYRMLPPLGGSSIVRESIPLPPDLTAAAEALVVEAGLDGYTEVEFRRDSDGAPFLMEVNPRLSASVEIAVRAGVDFPGLLYAWASGRPLPRAQGYREGVRMRWLGGDIRWLRKTLVDRGRPEVTPPTRAVGAFARDCFVPHAYDYVMWDDLRPAVTATTKFLTVAARRKLLTGRARNPA
jgi:predicted ATP-grasp superfamily ATP-dependent carboligase